MTLSQEFRVRNQKSLRISGFLWQTLLIFYHSDPLKIFSIQDGP